MDISSFCRKSEVMYSTFHKDYTKLDLKGTKTHVVIQIKISRLKYQWKAVPRVLSLYSTRTQNTWRRGLALGSALGMYISCVS